MLWTMDLSELLPFPLPSLLLRRSQRLCCESELDTDDERFITDIVALYDAVSCVLVVAVSAFFLGSSPIELLTGEGGERAVLTNL